MTSGGRLEVQQLRHNLTEALSQNIGIIFNETHSMLDSQINFPKGINFNCRRCRSCISHGLRGSAVAYYMEGPRFASWLRHEGHPV